MIKNLFRSTSPFPDRGGTGLRCLSIKRHDHVDRMGKADPSACFLSRGFFRLLCLLLFCLLFLFVYLLFPTLVLILLAFVSHCAPPFSVVPHLLAAIQHMRTDHGLSWMN